MHFKHLVFIPVFFISLFVWGQSEHYVTPFILDESKPALILKDARIFNEPNINSKQVSFLRAGTYVTLLSDEFASEYIDGGMFGGFVPVQFIVKNNTLKGYIHNSKLASAYFTGVDDAIYAFGPDKLDKDSVNLVYYLVARIDPKTSNMVTLAGTVYNRFYTECSAQSVVNGGLFGVDFIVQFILRDEGGNLETDTYSFAWSGSQFIQLPTTQYAYEAGVYTISEQLLLPNAVPEGPDFIKVVRSAYYYEPDEYGNLEEYERLTQVWYKWLNMKCVRVN